MILVDSSVWIDFFNDHATDATDSLAQLLDDAAAPIAIADLALFEVLRGFRHERDYVAAERVLRALEVVTIATLSRTARTRHHHRQPHRCAAS
jgi:predicted nucleic acid-binding protein